MGYILRSADFEELSRRLLEISHDMIAEANLHNWKLSGSTLDELDKNEFS